MRILLDEEVPGRTFLNAPLITRPEDVNTPYAFLGIPYGPPYHNVDLTACADAADEVRLESHRRSYALNWDHYDFDLSEALFPDGQPTVSDCGDVPSDIRNPDAIWYRGIEFNQRLISNGIVPLVVGGFDSIPPMVVKGFDKETVNVLHIDSHLDFRNERYGIEHGYSSPIRRIREHENVGQIVQVGLRGAGSARPQEVREALSQGNRLVTAWEIHESGPKSLLESLTDDARWVITIDCDGMDTSIAPAIGAREPGGLTFYEVRMIIAGLASQNRLAGLIFTEYQPSLDIQAITAHTIVRLMINAIGLQRDPVARTSG